MTGCGAITLLSWEEFLSLGLYDLTGGMTRVKKRGESSGRVMTHSAVLGAVVGVIYSSRIRASSEAEVVEAEVGLTRQIQRNLKATRRSLAPTRPEEPNLVTQ